MIITHSSSRVHKWEGGGLIFTKGMHTLMASKEMMKTQKLWYLSYRYCVSRRICRYFRQIFGCFLMYYVTSKYILKCYYFILLNNREAFITTTNLRYLYKSLVLFPGICEFFPSIGNVFPSSGDRWDDSHCWQERRRQDQLLRVQVSIAIQE